MLKEIMEQEFPEVEYKETPPVVLSHRKPYTRVGDLTLVRFINAVDGTSWEYVKVLGFYADNYMLVEQVDELGESSYFLAYKPPPGVRRSGQYIVCDYHKTNMYFGESP